ncbi:MAG: phage tail sheath subtilisin-like domain-containing protein [Anaerolineae bacterium]|nr:phage tail sheath subtilisin-like domain-containing protein [Anaerolineae bacterium]
MTDVILPGIYITVRDEGLISVGGVSTGNIGIVGTAEGGELNKVYTLSSLTEAKEIFGPPKDAPANNAPSKKNVVEPTLLKALELIFGNGGRTVYAVRVDNATADKYETGLALLENEIANIIVLAGQDVTNSDMVAKLTGHLNRTQEIHRERIGIIGSNGSTGADEIINSKSAAVLDNGRMIYVAPGVSLKKRDPATGEVSEEKLSGAYMAAAVAGLISSLPVQASPTNKIVNVTGLAVNFNYGDLEKLVKNNILAVEKREGYRVVKGVTTSTNTAWSQITTRRIVDYAIYGVRAACNPYIGKLNNIRVRSAMKATLDGFLTRMVESEALVGYSLDVSATRAQEIAGQAIVTMSIQPTFSIDYIMVTMTLG